MALDAGLEHGSTYQTLPHMPGRDDEKTSPSWPRAPLSEDVESVVDQIRALLVARCGRSEDPELDDLIVRLRAAIEGESQTYDRKPAMDSDSRSFRDMYPAARPTGHVDGRQRSESFGAVRKPAGRKIASFAEREFFDEMFPDASRIGIA